MAQAPYGRDTGRTFRPLDFNKRQRKTYVEALDPDAYSGLIDSYRDGYLGSTWNMLERQFTGGPTPEGWDPLDHVPEGYEDFVDSFTSVKNPAQLELTRQHIDLRLDLRQRRERRGFWSTFGSDLAAGVFDPSNLIAGPALKGIGVLSGTAKGALFVGALGAAQEGVVWATDPSMQPEEGRARVLGGALGGTALGGVLGGVLGSLGRSRAAGAAAAPVRSLSRDQVIRHVLIDLEGGDKLVNLDDGAGLTKYGITANNHPGVDVSSLTYDRAAAIARKEYWLPEFDQADARMAAIAFDAYYISGNRKLANSLLKAGSVDAALSRYRGFLNNLAETSSKHAKFKKGWNRRVDTLAGFVGSDSRPVIHAGASHPRGVELDGRGYIEIVRGPTGIYDEAGNYVPAAWVKGRPKPKDDFTLVEVEERPGRFETVERQAGQRVEVEIAVPDQPAAVLRPRVRAAPPEEEVRPRTVRDETDAAIELDRLERGDAEAARMTAKGLGPADETDRLPFALEAAAKRLPAEDARFLTDVVEAKGLANMNQPELNKLYRLVQRLPDVSEDAARIWMGRGYQGGKLTLGQVKKRINGLVARRHQLQQQAPAYQRDVAEFDYDALRDQLDRAMDEAVFNMERATLALDDLRIEKKARIAEEVDEVHPNIPNRKEVIAAIKKAWNAEYDEAISLAKERRYRIRDRIDAIKAERARYFGRAIAIDTLESEFEARWAEMPERAGREPPEDLKAIWRHDKEKQFLAQFTSSELRNMIQEKQSALIDFEANATRWVARDRKEVVFTKAQRRLFDKMTAEMNALINRLHQVEAFERELDDLLPFRLPVGGKGTAQTIPGSEGPHIAIDVDALLASFTAKPWTQSVHGLPGMAEDTFTTPEEWVNFVFLHEREHVQNPRAPGEELGAYEQRINDRALEALRGGDAPWKPVDGWKEQLVLAPTPIGQLMRLIVNPNNYAWQSIATLASDYDLRLQRNLVTGGASAAGGSVYQRAMRHMAKAADFYNKIEDLYLVYARGRGSDSGAIGKAYSTWRTSRGAASRGKMTFEEFDRAVGRTQATGKSHEVKEVNEAATLFNQLMVDMRRQEEALGLLPGRGEVEVQVNALRATIASLEKLEGRGPKGDAMLERHRDRLARLEARLDADPTVPGTKGLPYFTRIWNPSAMLKRPDEIKAIFRQAFIRNGQDPHGAAASADQLFDELVADPTGQSIEVSALPGELRSRQIPVENDEVVDFIHQDATIILARYMRRNGAAIEMTRAFGDPSGDLEADRVIAALEADGLGDGEIQAAMQIWYDARDRIVGGFHGDNPMSVSNRVVRFAKRWTRFAVMGLSGITQLTDTARAAWVLGPRSFAKGIFSPLFGQMAGKDPGRYAHAVGEALDIEMGLMARRMMDDDDWTMRVSETGIERLMGDLEVPFFILNGVAPFTMLMKRGVARAVPHMVIDRARRVAAAVRSGKAAPVEDATWLREVGIDEHDAQLLVDLPVEESKGGFIMADFDQWVELGEQGLRGRDLVQGAISGTVRRAVATPGPLNRPRIMDGIMIDKAERRQAWADRWAAERAEEDARRYVKELRKAGFRDGDPDMDRAVEALIEAAGAHKRARLNVGTKARKERPLLSLPFQLQSFAFSQSSKLLHSVVSGRDQRVLLGLLSLWGAGIVASWLKGEITGANEHAEIEEHIMRGFQSSGVLSWMSIPLEAAKGLSRVAIGETRLGDVTLIERDRPGVTDNVSMAGPTIGLGVGALEGMFGKGFDGQDLPASDRAYQLRRTLPFGNMIYFNWLVRQATAALTPGETPSEFEVPETGDLYGKTLEGMMGFSFGDIDPRIAVPEVDEGDEVEQDALDVDRLLQSMTARKKKKGRARKVDAVPIALQF